MQTRMHIYIVLNMLRDVNFFLEFAIITPQEEFVMYAKEKQTHYVSGIDQFLQEYDKNHPTLSKSQRKEIEKNLRIARLRDMPAVVESHKKLWDEF
jgi:hypothetical protein